MFKRKDIDKLKYTYFFCARAYYGGTNDFVCCGLVRTTPRKIWFEATNKALAIVNEHFKTDVITEHNIVFLALNPID